MYRKAVLLDEFDHVVDIIMDVQSPQYLRPKIRNTTVALTERDPMDGPDYDIEEYRYTNEQYPSGVMIFRLVKPGA